jgi:hypothetical protein
VTAVAMDCIDLDVGREGDGSRVGLAAASIKMGKAQGGFPFLHMRVGGERSTGKERVHIRLPGGFDRCGQKG